MPIIGVKRIFLSLAGRVILFSWRCEMPHKKTFDELQLAEIVARYEAGARVTDIAKDFNCNPQTAYRHLRSAKVNFRPRGRRPGSTEPCERVKAIAAELRASWETVTLQEIGDKYGVSRERVRQIAESCGISKFQATRERNTQIIEKLREISSQFDLSGCQLSYFCTNHYKLIDTKSTT
jgi:transposase